MLSRRAQKWFKFVNFQLYFFVFFALQLSCFQFRFLVEFIYKMDSSLPYCVSCSSNIHVCYWWQQEGQNCSEHSTKVSFFRTLEPSFFTTFKTVILKFIKFKLSHSLPPSSNNLFVTNAARKLWIRKFVMSTIQDSLTRQQINMIVIMLICWQF